MGVFFAYSKANQTHATSNHSDSIRVELKILCHSAINILSSYLLATLNYTETSD
jgi:hypothetical protein